MTATDGRGMSPDSPAARLHEGLRSPPTRSSAVEVTCTSATARISVSGPMSSATRTALREALFSLRAEHYVRVDLDLSATTRPGPATVRTILAGRRLLSCSGTRLVVAYPDRDGG
jgi:hypothetical protein